MPLLTPGVPLGFVYVTLDGRDFIKVEMFARDDVIDFKQRACESLGGVTPVDVKVYTLTKERAQEISRLGPPVGEADIAPAHALSSLDSLEAAGVTPGSFLLAHLVGLPTGGGGRGGARTLEQLLGLTPPLSQETVRILSIVRTRFSTRALLSTMEDNPASARAVFEDAKILPSTATSMDLGAMHGIVIGRAFNFEC